MSDTTSEIVPVEELDNEETDFSKDDYGFIIGSDGELKSIMYPEHLMEDPPEEIKMILQIFGIDTFEELENKTIH